jgi:hypothetical protein
MNNPEEILALRAHALDVIPVYVSQGLTRIYKFLFDDFSCEGMNESLMNALAHLQGSELSPVLTPLLKQLFTESRHNPATASLIKRVGDFEGNQQGFLSAALNIGAASASKHVQSREASMRQQSQTHTLFMSLYAVAGYETANRNLVRMLGAAIEMMLYSEVYLEEIRLAPISSVDIFTPNDSKQVNFDLIFPAIFELLDRLYEIKQQALVGV